MLFWLYNLLFLPLAVFYVVWFAFSNRRGLLKNLPRELGERFGIYPREMLERLSGKPVVWFHAASLGETKALQPLIERIRKEFPGFGLVLSSSNSVARAQAASLNGIDAAFLAPIDFYPLARKALQDIAPKALITAESELWPCLLRAAHEQGVRVVSVNARMSERSFGWFKRLQGLIVPALKAYDCVFAQTPADASRFEQLGVRPGRIFPVGNLKYDRFFDETSDLGPLRERVRKMGWKTSEPVFVAGSTHAGEEEAVLGAFRAIKERVPGARLILAPRHLERISEVRALLGRTGVRFSLWSGLENAAEPSDCLLLDTVGILPWLYGLSRLAYIGGTLVPRGGHNLLEPVRFSIPVIFGPHTENVRDIADLLIARGGGVEIRDEAALRETLADLFPDGARCSEMGKRAREAAEGLRGALEKTLSRLMPLLRSLQSPRPD